MTLDQRIVVRYSLAFKQKVVSEIESGKYCIDQARKIYGIGGSDTVRKWIIKLGKDHLINRVVRIEMKDEKDKIKELEKRQQELEKALANAHLKLMVMDSLIDNVEKYYKIDVKKNFGDPAAKMLEKKSKP